MSGSAMLQLKQQLSRITEKERQEITAQAQSRAAVKNYNVEVKEWN